VKLTDRDFAMVKMDFTLKGNPQHTRLLEHYGVKGLPTVAFLDGRGNECQNLRLVDYLPPEQMLSRMAAATKK
jgi:thiol:disulfide interchange protein